MQKSRKTTMTHQERILMWRCIFLMAGMIFFSFMAFIRARADDMPTQQRDWRFFFSKMYITEDREAVASNLTAEEVGVAVLSDETVAVGAALAASEIAASDVTEQQIAAAETLEETPDLAVGQSPEETPDVAIADTTEEKSEVAVAETSEEAPVVAAAPVISTAEPEEIMAMKPPAAIGRDKYYSWIVIPTANLTGETTKIESTKVSEVK